MPAKSRKSTKKTPKTKATIPAPTPTAAAAPAVLAPGTVLKKLDRHGAVRCECTVEADGFRYDGKLYSSISAAAAAAAKALGLSGTSFNGHVFWGITKPGARDPLRRLDHLWQRYTNAASALLKADGAEKASGLERVRQHVAQIKALV